MEQPESLRQETVQPAAVERRSAEAIYLAVGKLRRPHGLHGEMIFEVLTDFPERLRPGKLVFVGEKYTPHKIRTRRRYGDNLLIALEGYENPEQAGELRNQLVFVRSDTLPPLPEGEYYHHQLIGLRVITDEATPLGQVKEILVTGANDVCVVRPESGAEILLPMIPSVILKVDLSSGELHVHLLPGLVEGNLH